MSKVIRSTPAKGDSNHIRMVVNNNGKIPSRIEAILGNALANRISDVPVPLFDASLILAEETVKLAKNWTGGT